MASLETLPVELLDHVALNLDRRSLHAFRFVCRTIASAIKDTYRRRFYEHRTYLATPDGMQKLVEDTEREDYARHLKCITLVAPGIARGNSGGASRGLITDTGHKSKETEAEELVRKRFIETRTTAARSGMVASLLTEGLGNLRTRSYSPVIHVSDLIKSPTIITGFQDLVSEATRWALIPPRPMDLTHWSIDDVLPVVLTAIATSRFEVEILSITASKGLTDNALAGTEILFNTIRKPLRSLKRLDMSIGPNKRSAHDLSFGYFADILESTPMLQNMTLSLESCGTDRYCASDTLLRGFCAITTICLQRLTLEHMQVPVDDLVEGLGRVSDQLRSLHLVSISTEARDCFSDMFTKILEKFQLQELRLHDLVDAEGWVLGFKGNVANLWIKEAEVEGSLPTTSRNQVLLTGELPVLVPSDERGAGDIKSTLLELIEHEEYHLVDEAGIVVHTTKMPFQGEEEE
ncbi:hypothetical protein LTR56_020438 [Elasticomyces elasticus]|nr:hypothetical protein LTR56_020438 [Elasticomyces elasticus]KAK3666472.1 hypothetical protein LTR22_002777 [Elasticomyces elasticus]KAK4931292.1 hypothetical protein LTR49_002350 [Elasticomyces elasticus]KAK5767776.1 hypothetical protein LTS12_001928 [Elasticomyces elasticus]